MTSAEIQTLLDDANCLVCQGMTLAEAMKIVLLNQISGSQAKVYRALLTQTGVNAPVATVLENTLGGTPVWSYVGVGTYDCTLTGLFPVTKTMLLATNPEDNAVQEVFGARNGNRLRIAVGNFGGTTDDVLTNSGIQILVYP